MYRTTLLASVTLAFASSAFAAPPHVVDASQQPGAPETGYLKLGSTTAPDGTTLGINNRYLTYNGKPWMPVMGEIHFVRLPEDEWDASLAKIKASGVDIVATYIFWNYHEETPGDFNWSGRRDLRRFVELAGKHNLKVVLRLGPWGHGEVRYGGIPDWVVNALPTRGNDPTYLRHVDRYWGQIEQQTKGLLWKDGGPVIGVQLENEYNLNGKDQGRDHIATLKAMALRHGFDVPFYTVTGWDGAVYPNREVVPVFGGYPDEPWVSTKTKLPPKETFAFRFNSRVSGNLGAQTQGSAGDADADIPHTPFFGAEYGSGVPTMYRRRPVIAPADIASMLPVQIGSGVNLYGYYMYHGGSNLIGRTTLEESTASGGYNDMPLIDYDFQAPFGAFGQANPVANYIRPFHYMLESYGSMIAPTTVFQPKGTSSDNEDLKTLRWSVRAKGDAAFVFVNNHVRQYEMANQLGTQFTLNLPGGAVTFPSSPVNVPSDAYFIWPVGLDLGGATLSWASAQPVTRMDSPQGPLHVFSAVNGITPELAFPKGTQVSGGQVRNVDGKVVATVAKPGTAAVLTVRVPGKPDVRLLVITEEQARQLWRVGVAGQERLIISNDTLVGQGAALSFTSKGDPDFGFSVWPALPATAHGDLVLKIAGKDGLFTRYTAQAKPQAPIASITQIRSPGEAPAIMIGGLAKAAVQPYPETFGRSAGAWKVELSPDTLKGLDDAFLDIDWAGDIGRMFAGEKLIEDHFYDGRNWQIGLKRHKADLATPITLRVTPLRDDAPIYIDEKLRPSATPGGQIATVRSVKIVPQYKLTISF